MFVQFLGRLKNFRNHFRILLNIVRLCFIQKVDKIGLEVGNFLPLCFSLIMRFDVLVKGAESTKIGHIFFNCVDPVFRGGYRVESIQNLNSRWGI